MSYALLIGRRAILSRENRLLVNLTTWIAVLGVGLGVAALVVVNGVYDGYIGEIRQQFVAVLAHLDLTGSRGSAGSIRGDDEFLEQIASQPHVEAVSPILQREALLFPRSALSSRRAGAVILGVDLERTRHVTQLLNRLTIAGVEPGEGEVVLGKALAEKLGIAIGDTVIALTSFDTTQEGRPHVTRRALVVVNTFESGFYQFDQSLGFTTIEMARDMYDVPVDVADAIELRLDDPDNADLVKAQMQELLPGVNAETWREKYGMFFAGVELTRVALLIILLVLVIVACSNVVGSLIMMVHDRTRQIGILRAMGATRFSLIQVFLFCGAVIGSLGVFVGVLIGGGICWLLEATNLIRVPESVYFIDHLPVSIDPIKVALVAAATLIICLGAAVIPAMRAARLDPVEALRYE